jgi:hypothetical protein
LLTENLNATAKGSKDTEVGEMLGSKILSGCMSDRHLNNRRHLESVHYTEQQDCERQCLVSAFVKKLYHSALLSGTVL